MIVYRPQLHRVASIYLPIYLPAFFQFSRRRPRYFVLSSLDFGEFKFSSDSESSKWILDYDMWHGSPIFRKAEVLLGWLHIPHVLLHAIRKAAWGFSEMLPISNYI